MMNPAEITQKFNEFKRDFMQKYPGVNPQAKVQELLNSGKMSQQQFEQLRNIANSLTGRR